MEFQDDPFKDSNHRYGDPFDIEGADPFKDTETDPFTASVDDAFGTLPRKKEQVWGGDTDPFVMSGGVKPAPVSNNLDDSFDPFSAKNLSKDPFQDTFGGKSAFGGKSTSDDPFGQPDPFAGSPKKDNNTAKKDAFDPFGSSSTPKKDTFDAFGSDPFASNNQKPANFEPFNNKDPFAGSPKKDNKKETFDPFGSSTGWSTDPFSAAPSVQKSKTSIDPFSNLKSTPLQKSETTQSLSRPWGSDNPSSIPRSRPSTRSDNNFQALDLSQDKKEKKKYSIGNLRPSFIKKDKSGSKNTATKVIKNDLNPTAPPVEAANLRMASEASKKAEQERLERLRRQEEQDLAYAIALSKAEAASLNNQ